MGGSENHDEFTEGHEEFEGYSWDAADRKKEMERRIDAQVEEEWRKMFSPEEVKEKLANRVRLKKGEAILDEFRPLNCDYNAIAGHLMAWYHPEDGKANPSGVKHVREWWDKNKHTVPYPPSLSEALEQIRKAESGGEKFKYKTQKYMKKRGRIATCVQLVYQARFLGYKYLDACELAAILVSFGAVTGYGGLTAVKASGVEKMVREHEKNYPEKRFNYYERQWNLILKEIPEDGETWEHAKLIFSQAMEVREHLIKLDKDEYVKEIKGARDGIIKSKYPRAIKTKR